MAERASGPGREERAALDMSGEEFRAAGHRLVDRIADFYDSLRERAVTRGETPDAIRDLVGRGALPVDGASARELLDSLVPLLCDYSLHNGHPRFMGYITSSAAPLGALADLLAAAVNPNVGSWALAPVATEIEAQVVRWVAELVGFGAPCGGIMVSGGNMANFLGFLAARHAKTPWNLRTDGVGADARRLIVYASRETHTWIQKAADLFGLGTSAIRWLPTGRDAASARGRARAADRRGSRGRQLAVPGRRHRRQREHRRDRSATPRSRPSRAATTSGSTSTARMARRPPRCRRRPLT